MIQINFVYLFVMKNKDLIGKKICNYSIKAPKFWQSNTLNSKKNKLSLPKKKYYKKKIIY